MNRLRRLSLVIAMMLGITGLTASLQANTAVLGDVTPPLPWDFTTPAYIGNTGSGMLTVDNGSELASLYGILGYYIGASGTATISGSGSKWSSNGGLYIGYEGTGAITVADGGEVTTRTLHASLDNLYGDGTITATGGAVLDADLRLDATSGNHQTFQFGDGGTLNVTADWRGGLGAGYKTQGSLTIADGVAIVSEYGRLGYHLGAMGEATVTGPGSEWINHYELYVGRSGKGSLRVENGGKVSSREGSLGRDSGAIGDVTISGIDSQWTNYSELYVGNSGRGTLTVEAGGQVSSHYSYLGHYSGSTGTVTVTGPGSQWTNGSHLNSNLYVGYEGEGSLTITNAGLVSVRATLAIDCNGGADSFINMSTGGMLALASDEHGDDSLDDFLALVLGTDAIRYWNASLSDWAPLTEATFGVDYTLQYLTAGEFAGYTLLTVGAIPEPTSLVLVVCLCVPMVGRRFG